MKPSRLLVFTDADNVIPDVVWVSRERLAVLLDEAGHLTGAPELVVEVLSPDNENDRRDRELKLKLYSERGVQEYWIIDWQKQQVEAYRREQIAITVGQYAVSSRPVNQPSTAWFFIPSVSTLPLDLSLTTVRRI